MKPVEKQPAYLQNSKRFFFQVVVKFRNEISLFDSDQSSHIDLVALDNIIPWSQFRKTIPEITIHRLFTSLSAGEINTLIATAKSLDKEYQPPNFFAYDVISCPTEIDAMAVLQRLLTNENVEWAYIVNDSTPPHASINGDDVMEIHGYLSSAPVGVNAEYAWKIKGGNGEGNVKFIDIEQGWILDHESISVNTLPFTGFNYALHDHGAAVLGIIMMQTNNKGRSGITPKVKCNVVSQWRSDGFLNTADAVMAALAHLNFGDIILLEAQIGDSGRGKKLWPVEIHAANFDVIRLATALGIIVIEPAGNGSVYFNLSNDLDYFVLNGKKIFNRFDADFKDSGAIIVAGASATLPHTRIYNSNYGNRIDCYAWGEKVFTAGSFPGSSAGAIDKYTNNFSGTSSAAAIIAGVAISLQSIIEANNNFRLGPDEMRKILGSELYGTPSANGHSIDKIGVMPDLKKIVDAALFVNGEQRSSGTKISTMIKGG